MNLRHKVVLTGTITFCVIFLITLWLTPPLSEFILSDVKTGDAQLPTFDSGIRVEGDWIHGLVYIIIDNETGVEYLAIAKSKNHNYYDAISPRLDRDGKPMVSEEWLAAYGGSP